MQCNDYVGLPYEPMGRDRSGIDCWGLVRLIYAEQLGIILPSLDGATSDDAAEIVAMRGESWTKIDMAAPGDVVVFRIVGEIAHVGVVTKPGWFIHARRGQRVCVERLDSGPWRHRVEGIYRYTGEGARLPIVAVPHPLQTARWQGDLAPGMTLAQIADEIGKKAGSTIAHRVAMTVDGVPVAAELWPATVPTPGQRIEYRAIAGDDDMGRFFGALAVATFAWYAAPYIAGAGAFGSAGYTALAAGTGSLLGASVAAAAINIAGGLLLNQIFPVRLPSANDPGQAGRPILLRGASNQATPYGAIPVLLGRHRVTPPVGAQTYLEADGSDSYLRMLLVWGYGEMQVEDIRIGDTPLSSFQDVEILTVNGREVGEYATAAFTRIYGSDISQVRPDAELTNPDGATVNWSTQTLTDDCDNISVAIHFPQGLRSISTSSGGIGAAPFNADVQYQEIDPTTLAPITGWINVNGTIVASQVSLQTAWMSQIGFLGVTTRKFYIWTRIAFDARGRIIVRYGDMTEDPYAEPTGDLAVRYEYDQWGSAQAIPTKRLPDLGVGESPLWDVCFQGSTPFTSIDHRVVSGVTGCDLTITGATGSVAAGSSVSIDAIQLGANGQEYYKRKDPFSKTIKWNVPFGRYSVRVRRTNSSATDAAGATLFHTGVLVAVTGFSAARPINPPVPLAMTAIRIKASDQINGSVDGVNASVQVICPDWDSDTSTWVRRSTRNPASLLRYVLQHPANARAVADSAIWLPDLQDWHEYCDANGFTYDAYITGQRSMEDVLNDIAAAGRASKTRRDGRWTVIIDRARTDYAQHFTPHNTWGFESTRALPLMPHAFRVQFNNAQRGYQPDELLVYADGYDSTTATRIEGLSLPGVCEPAAIYRHARFHLAQLQLRPEVYTLGVDIEHIVCTRGDLVRVTHDVPLWGVGSGRIRNRIDGTTLELDEPMPMVAATQYTIRIRLEDGSSITRTVAAKLTDGMYAEITLTTSVDATQGKAGNLFLFGELGAEAVDLIVLGVEPQDNHSARITLVDYSPAVYDSDTGTIPPFNSQITLPAQLEKRVITVSPTITTLISDESVMSLLAPGIFGYGLRVAYTNPTNVPSAVEYVEAQLDYVGDAALNWQTTIPLAPLKAGAVQFGDVQESDAYRVRLRYVDNQGRTGPWSAVSTTTIVGKTSLPSDVASVSFEVAQGQLFLLWSEVDVIDLAGYEVRTVDSGWGDASPLYFGSDRRCRVTPPAAGASTSWYVRAKDYSRNYSAASAVATYSTAALPNVISVSSEFADTSLTNATVTLTWDAVSPSFGLDYYRVSYDSVSRKVKATSITLPADWLGSRAFTVTVIDLLGNESSGTSVAVTKLAPNPVGNLRTQVIDNNVLLFWDLPAKTSLPIQHVLIKRGAVADAWAAAETIGTKDGGFTSLQELVSGTYRYWATVVDTDGNLSTNMSVIATVAEPPDFIFQGSLDSTLTGTLTNALVEQGRIIMPVNLTETFEQHFTSRGWAGPSDQVAAGFPIYIQPTVSSASYQETFDFGTVLASSQVQLSYGGTTIAGDGLFTLTPRIELSPDNATWTVYDGQTQVFGTNFRYVRVTITQTVNSGSTSVYALELLNVTVFAKLKSEAGRIDALSTDANGSIYNFEKLFIDVTAVDATAKGTTALTTTYDFQDAIISGTYSVASGVATVNATGHNLIAGQNVRLMVASGTLASQVVTVVTTPTANQFTASVLDPDTSGNVDIYPQSARLYVFNSTSGARVSAEVSVSIKGY